MVSRGNFDRVAEKVDEIINVVNLLKDEFNKLKL
jgi:hypothetical protein